MNFPNFGWFCRFVHMSFTIPMKGQITSVLQVIRLTSEPDLVLESLYMCGDNLKKVDGHVLAGALVRIKTVDLGGVGTKLTVEQNIFRA